MVFFHCPEVRPLTQEVFDSQMLSGKKISFLRRVAEGMSPAEAAKMIGLSESVARKTLQTKKARAFMFDYAQEVLERAATKAANALIRQLDSDNEWIVQNAASKILQYLQTLHETSETTINVNFGSLPKPALPSQMIVGADGTVF